MQACLARLYIDEPFRKWFSADATAALEHYYLSAEERAALLAVDRLRLDDFARSLITKRRARMERAYPLLFALNGPIVRRCYSRFYHLYPAKRGWTIAQEIFDFGEFMQETLPAIQGLPAYASDLAKFERLCFAVLDACPSAEVSESQVAPELPAMNARPRLRSDVRVAEFGYDVAALESQLSRDPPVEAPELTPSASCVLFQCAPEGGLRMLRINAATRTIVNFCDGLRTVERIVSEVENRLGAADLTDGVVQALHRLLSAGTLVFASASHAAAPLGHRFASVVESFGE